MTLEQALETFKSELAERFIDRATLSEQYIDKGAHESVQMELSTLKTAHETLKTEHEGLKTTFGTLNAEVEENKDFVAIGKERLTELADEYARLGAALYGDKWNQETEDETLNALAVAAREKVLASKIGQMKADLYKLTRAGEEPSEQEGEGRLHMPKGHHADPQLYSFGKKVK